MTAQSHSLNQGDVLRFSALSATVERCHGETGLHVIQHSTPVTGVAGITVKLHHRRMRLRRIFRTHQFRIDARSADSAEVEIETFRIRHLKFRRNQFHLRINGVQFFQRFLPVTVKIGRARTAALIHFELFHRHIDQHDTILSPIYTAKERRRDSAALSPVFTDYFLSR